MRIERLMPLGGDINDGQPLIRQPDGRFIGAFDIMERQKLEEASMELFILKPGDLIAMQTMADDGEPAGYLFDVTRQELTNPGIGYGHWGPTMKVSGLLTGPDIPDQFNGKDLTFVGSNFGGGIGQSGIIGTGRHPLFQLEDRCKYMLPQLAGFEVYRNGKDGLQPIDPNRLDADTRESLRHHEERIAGFTQLMEKFGFGHFDIRNFSESHDYFHEDSSLPRHFSDKRFVAEYGAGMATGNGLVIYDKETGLWQEWKYYNFSNQDVMQVAFANLSGYKFSQVFWHSIADESAIYRAGASMTTFTSSSMSSLNVINYRASDDQTTDQLGVPLIGSYGRPFNPSIQIFANGEVRTPVDYPLTLVDEKYPGFLDEAFKLIKLVSSKPLTIQIGNDTEVIRNPEDELHKLLDKTKQT